MAPDRLSAVSGPGQNTSLGSPPQDTRLVSTEERVPLECRPPEASQGWKAEQPTSTADTRIASSYFRKGSFVKLSALARGEAAA